MMPVPREEPVWVQPFLAALGVCGNVTRSAELAGVDVTGPYNRRLRYPEFKAEWDQAKAEREVRAASIGDSGAAIVPREELAVGTGASGVRLGRTSAQRWSKAAEEAFLGELTATANVALAAKAAGFSAAAMYKRKLREPKFSAGWDAAVAIGRARLEAFLLVAADRSFDPDALPIAEGETKVTVGEAISILKHKPAGSASGADEAGEQAARVEEVNAAAERILMRLRRLREQIERERSAAGWTKYEDDWIPPGWIRA